MISFLAFVPPNDVQNSFDQLAALIHINMEMMHMEFWTYSRTIMLGGSVSMLQEVYQHFQSIFGICFIAEMTSFQRQMMALRFGTEGYKHMFLPVILCFGSFLKCYQKEETVVRVGILQNEGGHQPPPQRRRYVDCNQHILRIVDDFPNC